jgi:hypothetical protein
LDIVIYRDIKIYIKIDAGERVCIPHRFGGILI